MQARPAFARTRAKLATSVDAIAAAAGRSPFRSFWAGLAAIRHE